MESLQKFALPRMNPNDDFALIAKIYVADGDRVSSGDSLLDVCTSKINVTFCAEQNGYIALHVGEQQRLPVGHVLYSLFATREEALRAARRDEAARGTAVSSGPIRQSKAAREWLLNHPEQARTLPAGGLVTARHLQSRARVSRIEQVPPNKIFEIATIAGSESLGFCSTLSTTFMARALVSRHGGLALLSIILRETAKLLEKSPKFTAYFEQNHIHYYDKADIGLVIDSGSQTHLLTIESAERLSIEEMTLRIADYLLRMERNQLGSSDVRESTFTVTDLSSEKVMQFQPLLNGKQSAILGIGGDLSAPDKPIVLNLTFDHRVISGREAGRFLKTLRAALEHEGVESELPS